MADYEDEELDEEFDEEDEELDEEAKQQLLNAEAERKRQIEVKLLKNKLKKIFATVSQSGKTQLSPMEKRDVKKAKQHPELKNDINRINLVLTANKAKMVGKLISSSPILFYVAIGVLIVFLIIAVVAIIGSIMPNLFGDEGEPSAAYGITGTDFYGVRMIYTDNDKAANQIVEDYVEFVENGILEAEQITTVTAENGGENFSVELNVDIIVPENYDYSNFNEIEFKEDYLKLYEIVYSLARSDYETDNGTAFNGASLVECVNGIKYFGYADLTKLELISINSITANSTYVSADDVENKLTDADIQNAISTTLNEHYSTYTGLRTEKLFVKDYILSGDEMISGVKKENYVAMIFMPRKNVTFTKFSFAVGSVDLSNCSISVNGNVLEHDGNNLGNQNNQYYIYSKRTTIQTEQFADIDTNHLNALSTEMSLNDVLKLTNSLDYYLTSVEGEDYLTIRKNGVVVEMSNTEKFTVVEFETLWSA